MEDDDEIHSHPSAGSGSEDSQRSNHRISVTVASAAPPQNTLTLALSTQQPPIVTVTGGGGGGREECWSEGATGVLIEAWGERYLELNRGNLKQKHWKEVADVVNSREDYYYYYSKARKTDVQCKNRIDTVKKKYKSEKARIATGGGRSTWRFYERLDQLIGVTAKKKASPSLNTPLLRSVPVGIPVGVRSVSVESARLKQQQKIQQLQLQLQQQQQQRKRLRPPHAYSNSSESESEESDSDERKRARVAFNASSMWRQQRQKEEEDDHDNNNNNKKKKKKKKEGLREKSRGDSVRELTKAVMKFGEAYAQVESSKLQQMVEMQKQSMKFLKELELQRIQFLMKIQLEVSQLNPGRRNVGKNNHSGNHKQQ